MLFEYFGVTFFKLQWDNMTKNPSLFIYFLLTSESISYVQGKESSPDYQVDVDKKFADYERFYDVSEDDITNSPTSGSSVPVPVSFSGIMVLVLIVLKYGSWAATRQYAEL